MPVHVRLADVACEGAGLKAPHSYRIVLHASSAGKSVELRKAKSEYEKCKTNGRVMWHTVFSEKFALSTPPPRVTITLRQYNRITPSRDIATCFLDCSTLSNTKLLSIPMASTDATVDLSMRVMLTVSDYDPGILVQAAPDVDSILAINRGEAVVERGESRAGFAKTKLAPSSSADQIPFNAQVTGLDGPTVSMAHLLQTLEATMNVTDLLAEVHPFVKLVWGIMSSAYKVVNAQEHLDQNIVTLMEEMDDSCKAAMDAVPLKNRYRSTDEVFTQTLQQIIECGYFIKSYSDRSFGSRISRSLNSNNVAQQVQSYRRALSTLRHQLYEGGAPQSNVQILRIADDIANRMDDILLQELDYAHDANRALYDDALGCLPGTRTEILDVIMCWATGGDQLAGKGLGTIQVPNADCRVLWLCGLAGEGKSFIAISAAKIARMMGLLGSFCGFQVQLGSLNPSNMFSTIARDLADHDPVRKQHILDVIREKRDIRRVSSCRMQFEALILGSSMERTGVGETIIVIDAFDESGDLEARREALDVLTRHACDLPPGLRILVTSRFEYDVRRALSPPPLGAGILLMENIPKDSTIRDIDIYVRTSLRDLDEYSLPEAGVNRLAAAAETSFLWASSACRFLKDGHWDSMSPWEGLQSILDSNTGLDGVYQATLDRYFRPERMGVDGIALLKSILGVIMCAREPLSIRAIHYLGAESAVRDDLIRCQRLVHTMASLFYGTQDLDTPITPLHSSFVDFLQDERRSGQFWVDRNASNLHLASSCLTVMEKGLTFDICNLPTSFKRNVDIKGIDELVKTRISDHLSYACRFWAHHVSRLAEAEWNARIERGVNVLLSERVLYWLEVMSLIQSSPGSVLACLDQSKLPSMDLNALVNDVQQFTLMFNDPITHSAAHIYLSALPFVPSCSRLHHLLHQYPRTARLQQGRLLSWPDVLHILDGHANPVKSAAFSPDGSLIASCSGAEIHIAQLLESNRVVMLTETAAGDSLASYVTSISFSPDGTLIVSGSKNNTITMWNAHTGAVVGHPLTGHTHHVTSVAFSPDGRLVVSGSADKTIRLWDTETGADVGKPIIGHTEAVTSVAVSPDGMLIASGSDDHTIMIWDAKTGAIVRGPLNGHAQSVTSVAFSSDGALIASGSRDSTVRVWDARAGDAIGEPSNGHMGGVTSVAFSPDNTLIASGSDDCTIRLWNPFNGTAVGHPLTNHTSGVTSVIFSPDGRLIASGSDDKTVQVWNARAALATGLPPEPVAFPPQGPLIASGSCDKSISVVNASPGQDLQHSTGLLLDSDGWITGSSNELILWVPAAHRDGLYYGQDVKAMGNAHRTVLDTKDMAYGAEWAKCCEPITPLPKA